MLFDNVHKRLMLENSMLSMMEREDKLMTIVDYWSVVHNTAEEIRPKSMDCSFPE